VRRVIGPPGKRSLGLRAGISGDPAGVLIARNSGDPQLIEAARHRLDVRSLRRRCDIEKTGQGASGPTVDYSSPSIGTSWNWARVKGGGGVRALCCFSGPTSTA